MSKLAVAVKRLLVGRPQRALARHTLPQADRAARLLLATRSRRWPTRPRRSCSCCRVGGVAHPAPHAVVAAAVVLLLVIVVASYRQTCTPTPSAGGDTRSRRANLGARPALVAASALLVDYVLTVAVSVVAGVANIVAAGHRSAPTGGIFALVAIPPRRGQPARHQGVGHGLRDPRPTASWSASLPIVIGRDDRRASCSGTSAAGSGTEARRRRSRRLLVILLVLRAFASGCTALTGVEAISNGVPYFRQPKSRTPRRRSPSWAPSRSRCSSASPRSRSSRTCTWPRTPASWSARLRATPSTPSSPSSRHAVFGERRPGLLRGPGVHRRRSCSWPRTPRSTASRSSPRSSGHDGYLPRQLRRAATGSSSATAIVDPRRSSPACCIIGLRRRRHAA